jgi:hypothetical protein
MHPLFAQASAAIHDVIGAAIEGCEDQEPGGRFSASNYK